MIYIYLALLDWRNTPTEGIGTSPAQRLFGRRTRTLIPTKSSNYMHEHIQDNECKRKLTESKARQAKYYNSQTKPLQDLQPGQTIRMKLPGKETWTKGICVKKVNKRSYDVEVEGKKYRRNRRHLLKTNELPPGPYIDIDEYDLRQNSKELPFIVRRSGRERRKPDFYGNPISH